MLNLLFDSATAGVVVADAFALIAAVIDAPILVQNLMLLYLWNAVYVFVAALSCWTGAVADTVAVDGGLFRELSGGLLTAVKARGYLSRT